MYTDTGARPRDTYAKETPFGYRHFQNVHAGVSLEFRFESMKKSKKKVVLRVVAMWRSFYIDAATAVRLWRRGG